MPKSNKIIVLDKTTVNQIAAGEVIERPASVVKELVENSIDAGSTQLTIEVKDGGRKLIRVTDNGAGMRRAEVGVAFEKHSTSKIAKIEDLDTLTSLGFRGEALASIAAVSKVECITKPHGAEVGTIIRIEGGKLIHVKDIGCAEGTTIKVMELFYNIPARLKYLKREQTELAHISDIITRQVLIHTDIHFKLIHNDNELINAPITANELENIVNIYGKNVARELLPIETSSGTELKLNGYISKPSVTRGDISQISVFVNRRYVKNRLITQVIKNAYRNLIPKHRYPIVVLELELDPSKLDVNIHPTKRQVRFQDEYKVRGALFNALESTLRRHNLIGEMAVVNVLKPPGAPQPHSKLPVHLPPKPPVELQPQRIPIPGPHQTSLEASPHMKSLDTELERARPEDLAKSAPPSTLPAMLPAAQIHNKYIIAQTDEGLVIIDQHAAAERIMFERIQAGYQASEMQSQKLLTPIPLELTPKEINTLESHQDTLKAMGFEVEPFGKNTYYIRAVPVVLGRLENQAAIHDIIEDLISLGTVKDESTLKEQIIQIMACKAAIKTGEALSIPEMTTLIQELYNLENPYSCAHGRPTIIALTDKQLEKMFHRT